MRNRFHHISAINVSKAIGSVDVLLNLLFRAKFQSVDTTFNPVYHIDQTRMEETTNSMVERSQNH